jgi:thiol-disulfide isomerase/thioredoxin
MEDQALRARGSELWIWALVLLATGSVIALAVVQANRPTPASPAVATAAPEISLPVLGGGTAALPRDKVTLVDFWATWCAPCRESMPRLQTLWTEYRRRGVELYSVDTDDEAPDREQQVRAFLDRHRLKFPVVLDDGAATGAFSVSRLPTLLLLDGKGRVAWSHVGTLTDARQRELRAALDRALSPE